MKAIGPVGTQPHWMNAVDWRCTSCGKSPPCRCWVRLTCACGAATSVERFPEAGELDEIETKCPRCRVDEKGTEDAK